MARWGYGRAIPSETGDRKSTRLNSSHGYISYAVFCLKKKKKSQFDRYTGSVNERTVRRTPEFSRIRATIACVAGCTVRALSGRSIAAYTPLQAHSGLS